MPYYAVARGRAPGVFTTWDECEGQVKGFSGARYKKFNTESEARSFIQGNAGGSGGFDHAGPTGSYRPNVSSHSIVGPVVPSRTYATSVATASTAKRQATAMKPRQKQTTRNFGSSKNKSFNIDGIEDPDEINDAISKQMDVLESRLEKVKRNVDTIYSSASVTRGKRTLLIEPPEPSKRRRDEFDTDQGGFVQPAVVTKYMWQVYTDGACSSNGRRGARAGYGVWWGDGHSLNESGPVERATNNSGEIRAATRACQLARDNGLDKICINTDSKFLIDSATKWMHGWKRNGWQLKSGGPVKNMADFQDLDRAAQVLDVQWRYVEAHRGIHGNECADELARRGAAAGFQD